MLDQNGTSIFTADNGDQLIGTFAGTAKLSVPDSGPPPVADCSGTYWVTEGTGHFKGVTGTGTYSCHIILANPNYGLLVFKGTLTK
jgi:hypothetical protein